MIRAAFLAVFLASPAAAAPHVNAVYLKGLCSFDQPLDRQLYCGAYAAGVVDAGATDGKACVPERFVLDQMVKALSDYFADFEPSPSMTGQAAVIHAAARAFPCP